MNKPQPKTATYLDYHECEDYIAHKLGVKSLRDFTGKYRDYLEGKVLDVEYQDFWHCVCNNQDVTNGSYICICSDLHWPDWAKPIVEAFEKEFGLGQLYWVEW